MITLGEQTAKRIHAAVKKVENGSFSSARGKTNYESRTYWFKVTSATSPDVEDDNIIIYTADVYATPFEETALATGAQMLEANNAEIPVGEFVRPVDFINREGTWYHLVSYSRADAIFPVVLTQTGGSAGDATTACTYTYTVKTLSLIELGTGLSPQRPRPIGMMTAATRGTGYYEADGDFALAEAWEVPATEECS